jgi:hypothetical protein
MSINPKVAALVLGVASFFGAGQANAAGCDGSVQQMRNGRTVQCYYLPTVSNGRVDGLQQHVNHGGTYVSPWGTGATIGQSGGGYYPPVRHH